MLIFHYGVNLIHPQLFKENQNQSRPKGMINKYVNKLDVCTVQVSAMAFEH